MSLSSHLRDKSSPLRRFVETQLGDLRAVRADWVKARAGAVPIPLPDVYPSRSAGTAGIAIDRRVRWILTDSTPIDGPGPFIAAVLAAAHGHSPGPAAGARVVGGGLLGALLGVGSDGLVAFDPEAADLYRELVDGVGEGIAPLVEPYFSRLTSDFRVLDSGRQVLDEERERLAVQIGRESWRERV